MRLVDGIVVFEPHTECARLVFELLQFHCRDQLAVPKLAWKNLRAMTESCVWLNWFDVGGECASSLYIDTPIQEVVWFLSWYWPLNPGFCDQLWSLSNRFGVCVLNLISSTNTTGPCCLQTARRFLLQLVGNNICRPGQPIIAFLSWLILIWCWPRSQSSQTLMKIVLLPAPLRRAGVVPSKRRKRVLDQRPRRKPRPKPPRHPKRKRSPRPKQNPRPHRPRSRSRLTLSKMKFHQKFHQRNQRWARCFCWNPFTAT